MSKPIVQQTSTISLSELDLPVPVVYVCQEGQYNYTESQIHGYNYNTDFASGELSRPNSNNETFSWKGLAKNWTFGELQTKLYKQNYSNFFINEYDNEGQKEIRNKTMFFPAYGFCMKLLEYSTTHLYVYTYTQSKFRFFIVDPSLQNNLMIINVENGKGSFGNTGALYDYHYYEVKIKLYDSSINEGAGCIDYKKIGSSYGECIENVMEKKLLEWYGCIAPWFPKRSSLVCEENKEINITNENSKKEALNQLYFLATGQNVNLFSACLKPCVTMGLKLHELNVESDLVDIGGMEIDIHDEIIVETDVDAYDVFNLVVELGSALGLWLGTWNIIFLLTKYTYYSNLNMKISWEINYEKGGLGEKKYLKE